KIQIFGGVGLEEIAEDLDFHCRVGVGGGPGLLAGGPGHGLVGVVAPVFDGLVAGGRGLVGLGAGGGGACREQRVDRLGQGGGLDVPVFEFDTVDEDHGRAQETQGDGVI